ncbi:hypothetical protein AB0F73_16685 [Micromonospora purpureochromogenes]|uniref:hypothetical protein n=1 Tax=Micromonospora purpureochromogenes TaxID=47872 RepID=UPI00340F98F6
MGRILRPDPRAVAAVASLAAVAVLVTLLARHPANILTVGLALLCVLLATVAGTAVAALRERPSTTGVAPPGPPDAGPPVLDADTLDALDSAAVRAKLEELDDLRDR